MLYARARMELAVRQALVDARERLERLDPYDWVAVEAWVASIRPLVVAALPRQVEGFDRVTKTPGWVAGPLFASTDRSGRHRDNFAEAARTDEAANKKIASGAQQKILAFIGGLHALPALPPEPGAESTGGRLVIHNYGEAQVGDKYTTKIEGGSNVGAMAVGTGAKAMGNVTVTSQVPTQEQHREAVAKAQGALVRDQDALEQIDDRLFEALNQFLSMARKIQVDQMSIKDAQAKMKETIDDVWAQQIAKGMKPKLLPKTLEVAGAILTNPIMGEVAKRLIGP